MTLMRWGLSNAVRCGAVLCGVVVVVLVLTLGVDVGCWCWCLVSGVGVGVWCEVSVSGVGVCRFCASARLEHEHLNEHVRPRAKDKFEPAIHRQAARRKTACNC